MAKKGKKKRRKPKQKAQRSAKERKNPRKEREVEPVELWEIGVAQHMYEYVQAEAEAGETDPDVLDIDWTFFL